MIVDDKPPDRACRSEGDSRARRTGTFVRRVVASTVFAVVVFALQAAAEATSQDGWAYRRATTGTGRAISRSSPSVSSWKREAKIDSG